MALALPGVGPPKSRLSGQHPPGQRGQRDGLQDRDSVQLGRERLLARLVAKQRAARISARRAAEKRPAQQRRLPDPPPPALRRRLVEPERGEGDEVQRDERGREVGGGEERSEQVPERGLETLFAGHAVAIAVHAVTISGLPGV